MPHSYELTANAARVHQHGHTVRFSLIGDLEGHRRIVTVNRPDDLLTAKHQMAEYIFEHNTHEVQHHAVTSPPEPLTAVSIGHRPVLRHGPGFKAVPYSTLFTREEF